VSSMTVEESSIAVPRFLRRIALSFREARRPRQ
jgi:hypothetical protein